jgi:hypothetical protein
MFIFRSFALITYLRRLGVLCFLLVAFSLDVSAPCWKSLMVCEFSPVEPFRKLMYAIGMVETKGDTLAFNPVEQAVGIFQIRPIRLIDYNRRTGSSYCRSDLFSFEVSEKIFLYYAYQEGPYKLEQIARKWNGSGQLTTYYWNRIKKYL